MKIALDWDGTFTLHPRFWLDFIRMCTINGVDVRIITLRSPDMMDDRLQAVMDLIPVIFTSDKQKREYCDDINWHPDIWIDDMPEFIVRPDVLDYIRVFKGSESEES